MLESPWPILIIGLIIEAALMIALFQTRRAAMLWAIGGVALLVLLGVLVEQATVTDTKRIHQTLDEAAAGLVANGAARVKACVVPGDDGNLARQRIDEVIGKGEFREVSIRNLEVKFNYATSPPTAETTFTAVVRGRFRDAGEEVITWPVAVSVKLRKESGRWLVYGDPAYSYNMH